MTIPGGAGTYPMRKRSFLRARRTGFYQGSELSRYGLRPFTLPSVREVVSSLGITPVL